MQKKIQFVLLYLGIFVKRHKKQLLLSIISGFFLTILSIQLLAFLSLNTKRNLERIGVIGVFNENTLPIFIKSQLSFGLTRLDEKLDPEPAAAKSWTTDVTKKEYFFEIADNLFWHDGIRVKSSDLNTPIQDAEYYFPDEKTVKITLKDPYSPLPSILSIPILRKNLIGMGVYRAVRIIKNEDTITQLHITSQDQKYPPIIYKFYKNQSDAVTAFKLGEIDTLKNISDKNEFINWKNLEITENDMYDRMIIVMLNLKKAFFREKEIRQALNYAVKKDEKMNRVISPINPLSWAYSKKIRIYNYDPDLAKSILSKSSLASSSAEIVLSTYSPLVTIADSYASSLNELGLNVKVKVERSYPADYDMFLTVLPIPNDPDQYSYWQSTQENNIGGYNNPKIDKLLEEGRKNFDKDARIKIYSDFQRYIADDVPVVFMYYPKVYTIKRK